MISRRIFLGAAVASSYQLPRLSFAMPAMAPMAPVGEEMDEALELLAPYAPSFRGGLSNHGPMTAEALIALGQTDAVIPWVTKYRKRLEKRPATRKRIKATSWRNALGDGARNRDWDEWFTNELSESPWREVVGLWVPRLAPGIAAAGLHGVIRVGHAVCSLRLKENAARLDELARALAYWATEYLTLPGKPKGAKDKLAKDTGKWAPSRALQELERLPDALRKSRGLITTELKDLIGFQPFEAAINLVDPTAGTPSFMTDLLATFAGTFINTRSGSFEFLHAITGAAAIAEMLPLVKATQRADVQAFTWQVNAGVFARYSRDNLVATVDADPKQTSAEQLAKLAVASGDEHTIKLVAACTREWRRNPAPRFLAAASKRVKR